MKDKVCYVGVIVMVGDRDDWGLEIVEKYGF